MEPVYLSIQQEATGKRIRQLIREKGYSVRDIQEAMGFESPQAVYKWLSGKCLPNLDNFLILSRILHTSIEDILVVDGDIAVFRNEVSQMKAVWNREDFYWARIAGKLPGMIRMLSKVLYFKADKQQCNFSALSIPPNCVFLNFIIYLHVFKQIIYKKSIEA